MNVDDPPRILGKHEPGPGAEGTCCLPPSREFDFGSVIACTCGERFECVPRPFLRPQRLRDGLNPKTLWAPRGRQA